MIRFLEGVPEKHVMERLAKAGGSEIRLGKFDNDDSSARLAVNTFGWFIERPDRLPPLFPGMPTGPAVAWVDVEYCARFPWHGGRHPWLDAGVESDTHLIGVESKRFEPFRDTKRGSFSQAYDRPVWGSRMVPFEQMRDALSGGRERFDHLDAVQLVKHAFGLVTQAERRGKAPVLVYLFAEPQRAPATADKLTVHRAEVARFADAVAGAAVAFHALSYRDWLKDWPAAPSPVAAHAAAIEEEFHPW